VSRPNLPGERPLLLLSGGQDSAALASWFRPPGCLTVNYGQRPFRGELRAATAIAAALNLTAFTVECDLSEIGSGLLAREASQPSECAAKPSSPSPSPEWWPYRNQLLATIASAWALTRGYDVIVMGSVAGDAERHIDGGAEFYVSLDTVTAMQEGGIRIVAPALTLTSTELIEASGIGDGVLAYAHSCHVADYACGYCPGCVKQETVLRSLGRFQ
jgi:7-cyano-7-deazaguanine synthase